MVMGEICCILADVPLLTELIEEPDAKQGMPSCKIHSKVLGPVTLEPIDEQAANRDPPVQAAEEAAPSRQLLEI